MRLKIRFREPDGKPLRLMPHYNDLIQAFIYRNLDDWLAKELHDKGYIDPVTKRSFKLFTFSRLVPEERAVLRDGKITFLGDVSLVISTPVKAFIESLAQNLLNKQIFELGQKKLTLLSVELEGLPEYRERILVRTLSPITVYSSFESPFGEKKTYFYSPFEKKFEELILDNLRKKLRTFYGDDESEGSVRPYKVGTEDQRIVFYKGTVIKGWDGVFELNLPPKFFGLAFNSGLGSKNSQGFGCIEVWNKK
ncbi:MAG: CRISPR-associated endoribonuclease Cas6 [Deltaproteobacteria bacterium]|nr:CRISPR-associated endoribonuclease Cas6 [Deltaproteobacteria bacterium]